MRECTIRDLRHHVHALDDAGAIWHTDAEFRAEMLATLEAKWCPLVFAELECRLEAYWRAIDERASIIGAVTNQPDQTSDAEANALETLIADATQSSQSLIKMMVDREVHLEMSTRLAIAIAVEAWTGLDVRQGCGGSGGYLSLGCAAAIADELVRLGEGSVIPFVELFHECAREFANGRDRPVALALA